MKTIDKIILYLDGQMSDEQAALFEKELANSRRLREQLEQYKSFMLELGEMKNIPVDEDYFVNMVPRFRENLDKKKKHSFVPKFALGITTISAVIIILLFSFNRSSNNITNIPPSTVETKQNVYVLNYSPVQDQLGINYLSPDDAVDIDSTITSMLSDELNLSPQSLNDIASSNGSTDLESMLQGINQDEANQIYNELLHKRIY